MAGATAVVNMNTFKVKIEKYECYEAGTRNCSGNAYRSSESSSLLGDSSSKANDALFAKSLASNAAVASDTAVSSVIDEIDDTACGGSTVRD